MYAINLRIPVTTAMNCLKIFLNKLILFPVNKMHHKCNNLQKNRRNSAEQKYLFCCETSSSLTVGFNIPIRSSDQKPFVAFSKFFGYD